MIVETLIMGASMVGCMGCWAAVQKHRITMEVEKHKLNNEALKPPPEKPEPLSLEQQTFDVKRLREQQAIDARLKAEQQVFDAKKQALDHVLSRRRTLENKIDETRVRVTGYADKQYAQYRTDALEALEDARKEQMELVAQQAELLALIGDDDESSMDTTSKPIRVDTGGPVAGRVDDPGDVHDVELHDEEASRESAA